MGRTIPTATGLYLMEKEEYRVFRQALPKKDRKHFDDLFYFAKLGRMENSAIMATKPAPVHIMLMSMAFQHCKKLAEIQCQLEACKKAP